MMGGNRFGGFFSRFQGQQAGSAKAFSFKQKVEPIEICGKKYTINLADYNLMRQAKALGVELTKQIDNAKDTGADSVERLGGMLDALKKLVDLLLGKGEYDRLWKAAGGDVFNMLDLANFLLERVQEQNSRRAAETYLQK